MTEAEAGGARHHEERIALLQSISGGLVTATSAGLKGARTDQISRHCSVVFPLVRRFGLEDPERRSRDEMALKVEVIVAAACMLRKRLGDRAD